MHTFGRPTIQPSVVVARVKNDRHTWMDWHEFVRGGSHYGLEPDPMPVRVLPGVPDARKRKEFALCSSNAYGCFGGVHIFGHS